MRTKIDIIVTPHAALIEYLREIGIVHHGFHTYATPDPFKGYWEEGDPDWEWDDVLVISHATPEAIKGKNVAGVLPHSLSCLCNTFTEIPLHIPQELHGTELTVNDIKKYVGEPVTYKIHRISE